jgi:hypothetical protein
LRSCSYLHNYHVVAGDPLYAERYQPLLEESPAFCADDVDDLAAYLAGALEGGNGLPILKRIEQSRFRPSKKLMDHVGGVIKGDQEYVLLDEQLVVYETVLTSARAGFHGRKKKALIVRGGPGTGKSVIALNLMGDLMLEGVNTHYATGSKAFTETLRRVVGSRAGVQFKYFNSYMEADPDEIDVLICDEAHRIREFSHNRFTKKENRTNRPQLEELFEVSKTSVFFIDDQQVVRPNEIGSSDLIRKTAQQVGCEVLEFELEAQFRCAGSDGFVNWINNTLGVKRTANVLWDGSEGFDFRIYSAPEALEAAIRAKARGDQSARMTAGFCWPWSKPNPDGTLVDDLVIGDYRRPWNAKSGAGRLAAGIPKESLWAHEPGGLEQVGCVYTAQGFEFDYVGVIFGPDLVYDLDAQEWKGQKKNSHDTVVKRSGDGFADLVKNTYRVLLSRGLKGCFVHFMDQDTERFVKSRIEDPGRFAGEVLDEAEADPTPVASEDREFPFRVLDPSEAQPYENCVPLFELEAAAGAWSDPQSVDPVDAENDGEGCWVSLPEEFRHRPGLFVARVVGESMNRRVPNGSWCLFRRNPQGSRNGKVVLAQHHSIDDPETGGRFTVKVYESQKVAAADGSWAHEGIRLRPDSLDPAFEPIEIAEEDTADLQILVALLG